MKRSRLKIVLLIVALSLVLALTPVLAQEGGDAGQTDVAQPTAAADCWLPILLIGMGAIAVLGTREWLKEGGARYFGGKESPQ